MNTNKEATPEEIQEVTQIGKRLRTYLVHKNVTFAEAATLLGVSPSMITRLADGVNMTVDILERIMKSFPQLNSHWLVTGMGAMERGNAQRSGIEFLKKESTRKEEEGLARLRREYNQLPPWEHGPLTEEAVEILQVLLDQALYLDRLGINIQQRASEFVVLINDFENKKAQG